eukprot:CAMPEP_0174740888 /NCGR_PEP_ID=MMETSP1094-20130205/74735_1 /TAXON_ID=156173 /ORGANISM="Chrysochromulina brevifilum, Strain UTEX LB 985" /LENGTH=71 /DNA_ID=CAMNT_0015944671 /DNA_START=84 /DNA_END=296 /DNA_ORIENTATION=+
MTQQQLWTPHLPPASSSDVWLTAQTTTTPKQPLAMGVTVGVIGKLPSITIVQPPGSLGAAALTSRTVWILV